MKNFRLAYVYVYIQFGWLLFMTMLNLVIDRETDSIRPRDARPLVHLFDYVRRHLSTLAKAYAAQ